MFWRLLVVLTKSALMVAVLELLSPAAEAVGLQFRFLVKVASAISHTTALPYKEAEVLFLFFLATAILETAEFVWGLITG
jgi:hypothetical protein